MSSSTAETETQKRVYTKSKVPKVGAFKEADYPLKVQLSIIEDYKDRRKTLAYIAEKHNVTIEYVSFLARQYNLPYRVNNPKSPRRQRIIEAIKNDMPFEEIVEKFNIPKEQLSKLRGMSESAKARKLRLTRERIRRQKKEEKIIKLFNDGVKIVEIARLTKTDRDSVVKVLLANEETKSKLIARREEIERYSIVDYSILMPQVREMLKNGMDISQIARTLQKDTKAIRKIVNSDEESSKLHEENMKETFPVAQISEELREFFINGGNMDDAIKKFNLSREQIKRWRDRQMAKSKKQPEIPRLPPLRIKSEKRKRDEFASMLRTVLQLMGDSPVFFGNETPEEMALAERAAKQKKKETLQRFGSIIENLENMARTYPELRKEFAEELKRLK